MPLTFPVKEDALLHFVHEEEMPASNRKVSNTDRQRLVAAYEGGEDFVALADVLGINRDTARSVIRV